MKKIILLILAVAIMVPVFGQRKKDEEVVIPTFVEGITYSLPLTGIRIYVKAVKEEFEPGPYASYAEQLLGITDANTRASVKWDIKDVQIKTFAEPDPAQVYKAMGDAAYLLNLTPDGCLAGVNTNSITEGKNKVVTHQFLETPVFDDKFSFSNFNDSPMYISGDSTNNFRPIRVSVDQRATEAAARILESRMNQYDIAAGMLDEFHPDGEAYKASLKELKKTEANYLTLFTGRTKYAEETFSFDFIPTAVSERGDIVFRFSDEKGVVPASDLSGKPVMVIFEPVKNLANKYTTLAQSDNPSAGNSGVYYRMPGVATININFELNTIASARATIAQFGKVAPVPEELLLGDHSLEFHQETGAIKSVSKK